LYAKKISVSLAKHKAFSMPLIKECLKSLVLSTSNYVFAKISTGITVRKTKNHVTNPLSRAVILFKRQTIYFIYE
jgi:hypothetical protein